MRVGHHVVLGGILRPTGAGITTTDLHEDAAPGRRVNHRRVAWLMHHVRIRGNRRRRVRTTMPDLTAQRTQTRWGGTSVPLSRAMNKRYVGDVTCLSLSIVEGTDPDRAVVDCCGPACSAGPP